MPDLTSHIRFGSSLPKKALIILCKTGPARFWPITSGPEESLCKNQSITQSIILAKCNRSVNNFGKMQPACTTNFPLSVSGLVTFFHRQPGSYCEKPAQSQFSFWLTIRKQAGVQSWIIGPTMANASKLISIRIGCKSNLACLLGMGWWTKYTKEIINYKYNTRAVSTENNTEEICCMWPLLYHINLTACFSTHLFKYFVINQPTAESDETQSSIIL